MCRNHFHQGKSHECLFGLARLLTHECKLDQALELLEAAINASADIVYTTWQGSLAILTSKVSAIAEEERPGVIQRWLCCGVNKQKSTILQNLASLPGSIDKWWMMIELALRGTQGMEPAQFYSAKIKEIDKYFGYLSWSRILFRIEDSANAVKICKELIKVNGNRPEAYLILFSHYYYTIKDYDQAEDVASEAILKLQSPEIHNYYVLFCIFYCKVQFKLKRTRECLDFLIRKFIENPTYPIMLLYYGKFCTKSQDFLFQGAALGALVECTRLCDVSKLGGIYFWLSKAHMSGRQYKEAMDSIILALKYIEPKQLGKISQLNKWRSSLTESIEKIHTIENLLKTKNFEEHYESCKELCYQIKHLHKHEVDILKAQMYWKLGRSQRALHKLFAVSAISTVKMTAYFILLKYLRELENFKCLKTVAAEMIEKCKNPQVPSYVWVKANLAYAKAMSLNAKPGKAILILKCMAKLLPPLPFVRVDYTKSLQRASSIQDLTQAHSKTIETMNAYSYSNYKNSFVMNANNLRDFSQKVISEEIRVPSSNNTKKLQRTNTQLFGSFRRYKKQQTLEIKENEDAKDYTILGVCIPNLIEFRGFSICSNPCFLYKISKVSEKFSVNLQDGLSAINDYIELLKFEKDSVFREKMKNKAAGLRDRLMERS